MQVEQQSIYFIIVKEIESCIFVGGWVVRASLRFLCRGNGHRTNAVIFLGAPNMHHSVILVRFFFCPVVAGCLTVVGEYIPLVSCPSFCLWFFFFFSSFDSSLVGLYRDRCAWLHVMFHAMLFEKKKRKKRTSQNPVVLLSTLIHGGKITDAHDVLKRYSF